MFRQALLLTMQLTCGASTSTRLGPCQQRQKQTVLRDQLGPISGSNFVERLLERAGIPIIGRWSDILQVDKDTITPQGAVAMSRWVRNKCRKTCRMTGSFKRSNRAGVNAERIASRLLQCERAKKKAARAVSQLFLGVRIECAVPSSSV
ncbi:MAG: hypothetical protein U0894_07365 [Pirellulales bacterium]